ncbi:spermidine synthase [Candidimonas sp. SYP-B2681]|uniref:spermine/spermidine synthase domain-containing protein n=1 Tax=Candidimonas sp. SYP-B2681 TaxID=2497686 RepID=UPI000F8759B3|nr:spermidine synthase [Candidimonas sp. SYP-B2681]RTZ44651.1 spermidine synthase [Candidimonas sp. SYP-B2681]
MNNVTITEADGVRNMHFGTRWVQGSMRLDDPFALELEYVQQMMIWALFIHQPKSIVQLGLGAGALTKFCYRHFPQARTTAIELSSAVITANHAMFALPPNNSRLHVIEMDAMNFVQDPGNRGVVDVLQVDLYDADAHGPVFQSAEFYQACADCLTPQGMMTVNLFCDYPDHGKNLEAMDHAFEAVAWLPEVHDGNVVAMGFKQAPSVDFDQLYARAVLFRRDTGLPAESWVDGLQAWMQGA